MTRVIAIALCAALTSPLARAQDSQSEDQRFFQEAAGCAAALEARVIERQTQAYSEARNEAMLRDAEHGFTFIGLAYKRGLRNPQADEMLHAAEKRWAQLSKADKEARLASCTARGQQLLDDISMLEGFIVRNRAGARIDRLLEKERDRDKEKAAGTVHNKP